VRKPFFLYVQHGYWSPDPILGLMASAGGLSLQAVGFSGKGMASLPESPHNHSLAYVTGRKANMGRGGSYQETHLTWKLILRLALLMIRCSPNKQTGFLPYEVLFRRPPSPVKGINRDLTRK
jgi:hypothetical protein